MKDLSMFDTVTGSNLGTEIELHTLDGEKSGVFVTILGPDSDEAIKADRRIGLRNVKLVQKGMTDRINYTADIIEKLTACIVDWRGMPGPDGKELPFTKANAKKILTEYPAIRREILREHEDTRNFITGSSMNSSDMR